MQVWNVLHAPRWKCRTQKIAKNSPSEHHCASLSVYVFANKAHIDNRKILVKHQYLPQRSPQYGERRPTSGWDLSGSLGYPQLISTSFASCQRYCTALHYSSWRQPDFAALNRGRHLYSAGRPSRWALAHILVFLGFSIRTPLQCKSILMCVKTMKY